MRYVTLNTLVVVTAVFIGSALASAQDITPGSTAAIPNAAKAATGIPTLAAPAAATDFSPAANEQFAVRRVVVAGACCDNCNCSSSSVTRQRSRGNCCSGVLNRWRSRTVVRSRGCSTCN